MGTFWKKGVSLGELIYIKYMDEGKFGKINRKSEFPPVTKEDLQEIQELSYRLLGKFGISESKLPGFDVYSGIGEHVGFGGSIINSTVTYFQFIRALAFTRHKLIKKIIAPDFNKSDFSAKELVENKIMNGIKILDLGSSTEPVFARYCRALGADVWTADWDPEPFFSEPGSLTEEQKQIESKHHILVDLYAENAVDYIAQQSGGNFNLVTESQLMASGFTSGYSIAMPLLKKGGVYMNDAKIGKEKIKE
jgi:hypothetical protein